MGMENKVLHIMQDEKFIDYFIEQSEEITPGIVDYLVMLRHGKSDFVHVRSVHAKKIAWSKEIRYKDLNRAYKRIVLHGFYPQDMLAFVNSAPEHVQFYWMFLGGEGYKFTYSSKRWLLPATIKLTNKILQEETDWIRSQYRFLLNRFRKVRDAYTTRQMISRIDTCCTWVKEDFQMVRFIQPKMKFLQYAYFTYEQLGLEEAFPNEINLNSIWLGNSATATNNHLDAFKVLKGMNWAGDVVVPLSYGSPAYREKVIAEGIALFGSNFKPLTEFLPLPEYHRLMNQSGIVFMNHLRQQAAGNVLAALAMGKMVLLNTQSNLYKTLKGWGIEFLEEQELPSISSINPGRFRENRTIIRRRFSKSKSIEAVRLINSI